MIQSRRLLRKAAALFDPSVRTAGGLYETTIINFVNAQVVSVLVWGCVPYVGRDAFTPNLIDQTEEYV